MPDRSIDRQSALEEATLFRGLSAESRRALAAICTQVDLDRRQVLFHEGERGQAMFLLTRGYVRLHKTGLDGRQTVIKVVGPAEVFAEVVLFEEECYPVTAVAIADATVLRLGRPEIHEQLRHEAFRNDFIAMLLSKQRYLAERIQQLSAQDVEERFVHFLREQYGEQPQIRVEVSKKEIASAIAATPETLSRLLRRLQEQGLLHWRGRILRPAPELWRRG